MDALIPDCGDFYQKEAFSDVDVLIIEENEGLSEAKSPENTLEGLPNETKDFEQGLKIPAHSMVLIPFSGYCKIKVSKPQTLTPESQANQRPLLMLCC